MLTLFTSYSGPAIAPTSRYCTQGHTLLRAKMSPVFHLSRGGERLSRQLVMSPQLGREPQS